MTRTSSPPLLQTHATARPQPPTPPPGFTLLLYSVYFLTDGGYILSATNGGGDIGEDAIQTQFKYSLGSGTTAPSVIGANELFNVFKNANGQLALQTANGNFITAVNGGGLTADVLHTDAVTAAAWEEFRIAHTGGSGTFSVSIQTNSNNFLTAVGLGGKTTNAFHSDATKVGSWETFFVRKFGDLSVGDGQYFIVDTSKNQAIAASYGGGQTQNAIQFFGTNGKVDQAWAEFLFVPQSNGSYALRTIDDNYVTAVNSGGLATGTSTTDNIHTDATVASTWEQFRFVPSDDGSYLIQCFDGHFLGKRTSGGSAEGEYSTNISNLTAASKFWLVPTAFFQS
jgi:hypothetical protein